MAAAFDPQKLDGNFAPVELFEIGARGLYLTIHKSGRRMAIAASGHLSEEIERRAARQKLCLDVDEIGLSAIKGNEGIRRSKKQ